MPLIFNAGQLGAPSYEYIAWIDVMGTQASMSRSISASANFIAKLHSAALQAPRTTIRLYPVMDGFYAACADQDEMIEFIRSVFTQTADEFVRTTKEQHRFLVRGALAYGPIYHGSSINDQASAVLGANPAHRDALLMGIPMIQAHSSETQAPPFGLFIHESARAFAPNGQAPLPHSWWKWVNASNESSWTSIKSQLPVHFTWCKAHAHAIGYTSDRIDAHQEMVAQYFA